MKAEKPIIKKGDKILCPSCKNPLLYVKEDLFSREMVAAEKFQILEHKISFIDSIAEYKSPCCKTNWFSNGALYTQSNGWQPYEPHGDLH